MYNSQLPEMISLLLEWVDINSYTENIEGLERMLEALRQAFASLDGNIQIIPLPLRRSIDSEGKSTLIRVGKALRITKRSHLEHKVLLSGHMDTVFPINSPFQKGNMVSKEKMLGPGAADMKGGLMIMLKALELFEASPYAQEIGWEVLITPDEEVGSPSSEHLFLEAAKRCQAAMIFEPAFSDGALVSARKGSANFIAIARGRAAHAGRDFHLGINAITALSRFVIAADRLSNKDITVNVGHFKGGGPINIVPNLAVCRLNVRSENMDEFSQVENQLQKHAEAENIELIKLSSRVPKPFNANVETMFGILKDCGNQLGMDLQCRPSGGVSDGNIMEFAGVPTIDSLGAVGGDIHTDHEYLIVDSLVERAKLTALFLMHCATHPKLLASKFKIP